MPSIGRLSSFFMGKPVVAMNVRFGSKADMCGAPTHVRFTPNSDRESRHPQTVMSALPPEADMCGATRDVRFGPKADRAGLFDHLVGRDEQARRHCQPKRFGRLNVEGCYELGRRLYRKIGGFGTSQNTIEV